MSNDTVTGAVYAEKDPLDMTLREFVALGPSGNNFNTALFGGPGEATMLVIAQGNAVEYLLTALDDAKMIDLREMTRTAVRVEGKRGEA